MTPNEINLRIAEAVGWTNIVHEFPENTPYGHPPGMVAPGGDLRWVERSRVPNFYHDLNACHEAEQKLTDDDFRNYELWLYHTTTTNPNPNYGMHRAMICATAPQRCEAFLRTLGKWEN